MTLPDLFTATPDPITAPGTLSCTYTNPDLAGSTVNITVDNGEGGTPETIPVNLDSNGYAEFEVEVEAGWVSVHLNGPGSKQHPVEVN